MMFCIGLLTSLTISSRFRGEISPPYYKGVFMATNKTSIEAQKERDSKPVTGRFRYIERPGQTLRFPYRKYKEPIKIWVFKDGEMYTIPRGIASHLQREGKYAIHEHCLDEHGKPSMRVGHMVDRFTFESIGFLDEEDAETPTLYTAEIIPEKKSK
jgi:hypothetical protein